MYVKNDNENIVLYDCDDTLIFFDGPPEIDPISIAIGPYSERVWPNYAVIEKLKRSKFRGHYVRVHSQGGVDWAESVVKALGLEEYVDSVEAKPKWFVDDLEWNAFCERFYVKRLTK